MSTETNPSAAPPTDAFVEAVSWTIKAEGGAKVTKDAGGWTKWGIAQRYHPGVNVRELSRNDAEAIYRADYWNAVGCGRFPPAVGFVLFECAVNPGQGFALRALQESVGVAPDGILGPKTVAAVFSCPERELIKELLWRRGAYWFEQARRYPLKMQYLHGWFRRNYDLALAVGAWLERGEPILTPLLDEVGRA